MQGSPDIATAILESVAIERLQLCLEGLSALSTRRSARQIVRSLSATDRWMVSRLVTDDMLDSMIEEFRGQSAAEVKLGLEVFRYLVADVAVVFASWTADDWDQTIERSGVGKIRDLFNSLGHWNQPQAIRKLAARLVQADLEQLLRRRETTTLSQLNGLLGFVDLYAPDYVQPFLSALIRCDLHSLLAEAEADKANNLLWQILQLNDPELTAAFTEANREQLLNLADVVEMPMTFWLSWNLFLADPELAERFLQKGLICEQFASADSLYGIAARGLCSLVAEEKGDFGGPLTQADILSAIEAVDSSDVAPIFHSLILQAAMNSVERSDDWLFEVINLEDLEAATQVLTIERSRQVVLGIIGQAELRAPSP